MRRISGSRRPVINPLDELAVFSDSDEEMEYVQKMNINLPPNEFLIRRKHVEIQCNMNENVELKDILRLISTCRFENAMKSEIEEVRSLVKQLSMKYNIENVPTFISSAESDFESATGDSDANHQQQECPNTIPIKEQNKNSGEIEETVKQKRRQSSRGCIDISGMQKKRGQRPSENCLQLLESEKEIHSKKLPNIFVDQAKTMNEVSKSELKYQKESKVTDIDISDSSHMFTFKKPNLKLLKSIKPKSTIKNRLSVGVKKKHCSDEPISSQSSSDWSILNKSSVFKKPIVDLRPLARNWMKSRHSFSCTGNPKVIEPHFMSFQSHLKRRRLYSPSEWLNSREFIGQQYD